MENYVGKRIDGRYEIHEIIGVGGMAVVYKAYDNIDDRMVAVKILKDEYITNEEFRRRFKNESKYIAVLSHPNIVKVYDVSFGDRLQYIVMEYIEGITLKEYIEQQRVIQPKEAVHFVTQILRALQHAHDNSIVHRDVKPQNIMLLQNGSIKVTDFGIASFSRSDTRTMSDSAIGSVHYISPEQARGDFTDAKADIYSVGVVMYEMLTGTLPFQSDSAVSVALMQLQNEPISPREINASIPLGLEQITVRAMQKDPKARYQSAAEMLLDLDEYKRNPSIKFDYSYFVDNEPTKFIDRTATMKTQTVPKPVVKQQPIEEDDDDDVQGNSKLVPIFTGIIAGLVAVLLLIGGYLLLFTNTFKGSKDSVPDFVDMHYDDEIKGNSKYDDYNIQVEYEYDPQYDFGVVIEQSPKKGEKLKDGEIILLTVNSDETKPVPDVYGQSYITAKTTLENAGFVVTQELVYDISVEEMSVISTSPQHNEQAGVGSVVTLMVATHTDADAVPVPKLVGYDLQTAEELLMSVGLVLGEITPEDSVLPKDTVIEQLPAEDESTKIGNAVAVVVSSGTAPITTTELTIPLPYKSNTSGSLKAFVNNVAVSQASAEVLLDGGSYTFTVSGSGKSDTISVTVDGATIYSCTIDFTSDPINVTNEKTVNPNDEYYQSYYLGDTKAMPDVTGMDEMTARAALTEAGFKNENIVVEKRNTIRSDEYGKVIQQNPSSKSAFGTSAMYPVDTKITIYIGKSVLE